ncbi:MAG: hypothetical protein QOI34_517 [Verrucomicrobiota bacterium]|jgi:hypothetical protein
MKRGLSGQINRRTSTYSAIRYLSDCAEMSSGSSYVINSRMRLSPEDKLDALRRLDSFRHWTSLDDERQCLCCGKIINGRQIEVSGGSRGRGPLQLHCPTEHCDALPIDWILPDKAIRTTSNTARPMIERNARSQEISHYSLSENLKQLREKLRTRRVRLASL